MKLIDSSAESEAMARDANPASGAVLVPAFTGLGAPYWEPDARAALFGMTRDTEREGKSCDPAVQGVLRRAMDADGGGHERRRG